MLGNSDKHQISKSRKIEIDKKRIENGLNTLFTKQNGDMITLDDVENFDTCRHSEEKREVIVHEHQYENKFTCQACGKIRREYERRAGGSRVTPLNDVIV